MGLTPQQVKGIVVRIQGCLRRIPPDPRTADTEFTRVFDNFYQGILGWVRKRTRYRQAKSAEDLAHETVTVAWERISTLNEPSAFRSWLYGIAKNTVRGFFRKPIPQNGRHVDCIHWAAASDFTVDALINNRSIQEGLET